MAIELIRLSESALYCRQWSLDGKSCGCSVRSRATGHLSQESFSSNPYRRAIEHRWTEFLLLCCGTRERNVPSRRGHELHSPCTCPDPDPRTWRRDMPRIVVGRTCSASGLKGGWIRLWKWLLVTGFGWSAFYAMPPTAAVLLECFSPPHSLPRWISPCACICLMVAAMLDKFVFHPDSQG